MAGTRDARFGDRVGGGGMDEDCGIWCIGVAVAPMSALAAAEDRQEPESDGLLLPMIPNPLAALSGFSGDAATPMSLPERESALAAECCRISNAKTGLS